MAFSNSSTNNSNANGGDSGGDNSSTSSAVTSKEDAQTTSTPRPHAIIEISPPWSRQFEHFKNLATYCEVDYSSVTQERDHSEVQVAEVVGLVRGALCL